MTYIDLNIGGVVLAGGVLAGVVPNYFALGKIVGYQKFQAQILFEVLSC